MIGILRNIRRHWNRRDTMMLLGNVVAFVLLWRNCWLESLPVTLIACATPLLLLIPFAWRDATLRKSLVFGLLLGIAWPFGEVVVVRSFGWWGEYLAPGPVLFVTPLYCVLVGWTASTYIDYLGRRTHEMGYGRVVAAIHCGLAACIIGAVGENFFVDGGMWRYYPSSYDIGAVPAFVPVAYGLGYAARPLMWERHFLWESVCFCSYLLIVCVGAGLMVGFFALP